MEQAKWAPAHDALERLKQLNPTEAKPWLLAALSYYRMGDDPAAIYAADRAVQLDPSDPLIYLILRLSYDRLEEWNELRKVDMKISSLIHPGSTLYHIHEAFSKINEGNIEYAIEAILKYHRSDKYVTMVLSFIAMMLMDHGDKARSIDVIKSAIGNLEVLEKNDIYNKFFKYKFFKYLLLGLLNEQEGKIPKGEQYFNKL
jgi:tetratricopeptide (TPR) repeat protein